MSSQQQVIEEEEEDIDECELEERMSKCTTCTGSSSSCSNTPTPFQRQEALQRVQENAGKVWKSLPRQWQQEKEFILAALQYSPTLPSKSEFERQMTQALRFDKQVVLGFCGRPDFTELYYQRHLYVPHVLTSDKDVILAYCQAKIPRTLQEASEDLCRDKQVVMEAIRHVGGLELQYASRELQCDKQILQLACQSYGGALEFCPLGSPTRQELLADRDFMYHVVLAKPGGGPMWKLLANDQMKYHDPELLLQALKHGLLLRDIPQDYQNDLEFLPLALQQNAQLYLQLPLVKQRLPALALEAVVSEQSTPPIHLKALQCCPELRHNRQAVLAICHRGNVNFIQQLLQNRDILTLGGPEDENNNHHQQHQQQPPQQPETNHNNINNNLMEHMNDNGLDHLMGQLPIPPLPPADQNPFCNDVDIMLVAIQRDSKLFALASPRLQEMPEIILASITPTSAWNTLKTVSWPTQRQHPQIPIKAVHVCSTRNLRYLPSHIPEDLWTLNRTLCMTWIQRGGRVLEAFERLLRQGEDVELALAVAKYNWSEFHKVGEFLLSDRHFMEQALQQDGRVLRYASPDLRQDLELLVLAVANHNINLKKDHTTSTHGASARPATTVHGDYYHRHHQHLRHHQLQQQLRPEPPLRFHHHHDHHHHHHHDHHHFRPYDAWTNNNNSTTASTTANNNNNNNNSANNNNHEPPVTLNANVVTTFSGIADLNELQVYISSQLQLQQVFVKEFLRGICISPQPVVAPARRSALPMLDRGVETSQAFKKLIAEYLGVPCGPRLFLLRQAYANLVVVPPPPTTTPSSSSLTTSNTTTTTTSNSNIHSTTAPVVASIAAASAAAAAADALTGNETNNRPYHYLDHVDDDDVEEDMIMMMGGAGAGGIGAAARQGDVGPFLEDEDDEDQELFLEDLDDDIDDEDDIDIDDLALHQRRLRDVAAARFRQQRQRQRQREQQQQQAFLVRVANARLGGAAAAAAAAAEQLPQPPGLLVPRDIWEQQQDQLGHHALHQDHHHHNNNDNNMEMI